jgi:hypothetical protein
MIEITLSSGRGIVVTNKTLAEIEHALVYGIKSLRCDTPFGITLINPDYIASARDVTS